MDHPRPHREHAGPGRPAGRAAAGAARHPGQVAAALTRTGEGSDPAGTGDDEIAQVARRRWGYDELRPEQHRAIAAAVGGRDVLAILPTGAGKSAIYQVAAAIIPGLTVVVSPLIALQVDQAAGLDEAPDAPPSAVLNSQLGKRQERQFWADVEAGRVEYLLLAPEQLTKPDVLERLAAQHVSLIAVDEAHCVSAWGHDFRPDYLRLGAAVQALGRPTVIALTATGSPPVRDEILRQLRMRDGLVVAASFERPNIRLSVRRHVVDDDKRNAVVADVVRLPKPGLVYVATRADTEELAAELAEHGLRARFYHGSMSRAERQSAHQEFRDDALDVVVATSAFGMGIDKPNVRFVVHAAVTESVDDYYQQLGRAGRDGEPAEAILHYRPEDLGLRKFFASGTPSRGRLEAVLEALAATERLSPRELGHLLEESPRRLGGVLNLLEQSGAVRRSTGDVRLVPGVDVQQAAGDALAYADQRVRIEESRVEMIRAYAEARRCRREVLLGYFGEDFTPPCGRCDICEQEPDPDAGPEDAVADGPAAANGFALQQRVDHREWGPGTVMELEDDRLTVYFESEGYKVLSLVAVVENELLTAT